MVSVLPVVLSGGSGTRLWPISREKYPKQLLPLVDEQSMLQATVARLDGLADLAQPLLICNEEHRFVVAEQVRLLRWAPGTAQAPQGYPGGAELLVLEGSLQDERGEYPAGSWLRCPAQFSHRPGSTEGCLLWCKSGHLAP